jgi:hypothetical protein
MKNSNEKTYFQMQIEICSMWLMMMMIVMIVDEELKVNNNTM